MWTLNKPVSVFTSFVTTEAYGWMAPFFGFGFGAGFTVSLAFFLLFYFLRCASASTEKPKTNKTTNNLEITFCIINLYLKVSVKINFPNLILK